MKYPSFSDAPTSSATGTVRCALARSIPPNRRWLILAIWVQLACFPVNLSGAESIVAAFNMAIESPEAQCNEPWLNGPELRQWYKEVNMDPLWVGEDGPLNRARILFTRLQQSYQEGLPPGRYRLGDIEARWDSGDDMDHACLDLILTTMFVRYARDIYSGLLDPRDMDPSWQIEVEEADIPSLLAAVESTDRFERVVTSLLPQFSAYQALRLALGKYRRIVQHGGWSGLADGPALEPGTTDARIPGLRARLFVSGDIDTIKAVDYLQYDQKLEQAVRHFQRRHGLPVDGIVGRQTLRELNIPPAERIAQIKRAMERWRWLSRMPEGRYVLVNTAGYELRVIQREQTELVMKIIVGNTEQPTPSFYSRLTYFTVNPYWNVPPRIARDILLPKQKRDPRFLASRDFHLYRKNGDEMSEINPDNLDWRAIGPEDIDFRVRQNPGPKNSLGRISFYAPNSFDIFLHDTNQPDLFRQSVRTFSEGCVRLEMPIALAALLMDGTDGWSRDRIHLEIASLRHQIVEIPAPVPVYVLYLTSWVDEAGVVHFRDDVYKREQMLALYLPAETGD